MIWDVLQLPTEERPPGTDRDEEGRMDENCRSADTTRGV